MRNAPRSSDRDPTPLIVQPVDGDAAAYPGSESTAEKAAFRRAMERFRRTHNRPFPTFAEVLRVAKSLGYERHPNPETA